MLSEESPAFSRKLLNSQMRWNRYRESSAIASVSGTLLTCFEWVHIRMSLGNKNWWEHTVESQGQKKRERERLIVDIPPRHEPDLHGVDSDPRDSPSREREREQTNFFLQKK